MQEIFMQCDINKKYGGLLRILWFCGHGLDGSIIAYRFKTFLWTALQYVYSGVTIRPLFGGHILFFGKK